MATLADVARMSDTSRSTASRALNNDPRISAPTAERVRRVAVELDYRPNVAARSLTTGRSGIVGLVFPTQRLQGDPYGAQVVSAVTSAAMRRDHAVMLWLSHTRPGSAVEQAFMSGLIDGLIISIVAQVDPWVDSIIDSGLPCVLLGRHATRTGASFASVDNVAGTRALMAHLLECGYRRIAMIRGPIGNTDADERYATYVDALGGVDEIDPDLVAVGDYTYTGGYAHASQLLAQRPDCIVGGNDHTALGAIDAILDAGLRVPSDIAVTGWDDMPELRRPSVGLTTVHQDVEAVGNEAVAALLELLGGALGPLHRVLPTSLVVRQSTSRLSSLGRQLTG